MDVTTSAAAGKYQNLQLSDAWSKIIHHSLTKTMATTTEMSTAIVTRMIPNTAITAPTIVFDSFTSVVIQQKKKFDINE